MERELGDSETGSPAALAMRYDWRDNSLVLIHNFDDLPHEITANQLLYESLCVIELRVVS